MTSVIGVKLRPRSLGERWIVTRKSGCTYVSQPSCASTSRCTHMKTCPDCNGDGVVDKDTDDERQCPTCGGLGFVPDDDKDHEEVIKTSRDLPHRQGAAWTRRGASRQHCQTANATRQALG